MKKLTDKQKVYNLFKKRKTLYFSDICDKLDMDLQKVYKICQVLLEEGSIKVSLVEKEKK